jgi:DNA-binding NarL/FixJ family response regulator
MRIILVGPADARDRIRPRLIAAGFSIESEQPTKQPGDVLSNADAVLELRDDGRESSPSSLDDESRGTPRAIEEPLTPREADVLARLAEGLPNKAIALALGISDQTVKFHVAAIIAKLGATNRTDAVRRAIRRGLVAI